jgi:hypothetical protein
MGVEEPSARHGNLLFKEAYGGGLNEATSTITTGRPQGYVHTKPMKPPSLYKSRPPGFVVTGWRYPDDLRHIRSI